MKSKSKVNEAGNYTKPTMRKRLFNSSTKKKAKKIIRKRSKPQSGY